jgi:hypothetical protein
MTLASVAGACSCLANLADRVAFSASRRVTLTVAAVVSMMTLQGALPVGKTLPLRSHSSATCRYVLFFSA